MTERRGIGTRGPYVHTAEITSKHPLHRMFVMNLKESAGADEASSDRVVNSSAPRG
jgi:hypothetical protein